MTACLPDESMDSKKQANGMWEIPLVDLIYLEDGCTEHEGDRLLWGMKNTLENAIREYVDGRSSLPMSNAANAE